MFYVKVKAILLEDVSFSTTGGTHHLDVGTIIELEPEENIGYYKGYHFDLGKDEYKVTFLN